MNLSEALEPVDFDQSWRLFNDLARYVASTACTTIPKNMREATLFGYERGSFTGAHASLAGKFAQAQVGTLFLDEFTGMSFV